MLKLYASAALNPHGGYHIKVDESPAPGLASQAVCLGVDDPPTVQGIFANAKIGSSAILSLNGLCIFDRRELKMVLSKTPICETMTRAWSFTAKMMRQTSMDYCVFHKSTIDIHLDLNRTDCAILRLYGYDVRFVDEKQYPRGVFCEEAYDNGFFLGYSIGSDHDPSSKGRVRLFCDNPTVRTALSEARDNLDEDSPYAYKVKLWAPMVFPRSYVDHHSERDDETHVAEVTGLYFTEAEAIQNVPFATDSIISEYEEVWLMLKESQGKLAMALLLSGYKVLSYAK